MPPQIGLKPKDWPESQSATFMRTRDRHGDLSNMTHGFPITLNGVAVQGPEGLYQALKFPDHPEIQREIAAQQSGMAAKKTAYKYPKLLRPDWDEVKLDAMAITLALKLAQHPQRFGNALKRTGNLFIVECSYRDQWWGATPTRNGTLRGVNALGQLLTALRDLHAEEPQTAHDQMLHNADCSRFALNGQPMPF